MTDWQRRRREDARKAYDALMKFYPLTPDDLDGEQWRDIAGYEGLYQVSTFGRTKSFKYKTPRILKPVVNNQGYLYLVLRNGSKSKHHLVHRLVAETFLTKIEGKDNVNHGDGHPLNCHVSNLAWCTQSENAQHAVAIGLHEILKGEDNPNAKLTNAQVALIRDNPDNLSRKELAKQFGVDTNTIHHVQLGKRYRNAGGKVSTAQQNVIPLEIRREIRKLYVPRDCEYGVRALARKYGYSKMTISRIVNERDD